MKNKQYSFLQRLLMQMGEGQKAGRVMGATTSRPPAPTRAQILMQTIKNTGIPQAVSETPQRYTDLIDRINPYRLLMPTSGMETDQNSPAFGRMRKLTPEEMIKQRKKYGLINEKALWEK